MSKPLKFFWKVEERKAPWNVGIVGRSYPNAMFQTLSLFYDQPRKDESKDLLNNCVHRYGFLALDFDSKDEEEARDDTIRAVNKLVEFGVIPQEMKLYYSGSKGFHIVIDQKIIGSDEGSPWLPLIYRKMVDDLFPVSEFKCLDRSLYAMKNGKMFRLPNVKRENGRHKIRIYWDELQNMPMKTIQKKSLLPREESMPSEPVKNDFFSAKFVECESMVIEAIKASQNRSQGLKTVSLGEGTIPPCLKKILSMKDKPEEYDASFNEMCHGAIVPCFKLAGFTLETALETSELNGFLDEFEGSTVYDSPQARQEHLEQVWETDDRNTRDFSCGEMWKIAGKDWSLCSECPVKAENLFGEMYEGEFEEKTDENGGVNSVGKEETNTETTSDHPLIAEINKRYTLIFIGGKEVIAERFRDGELKILTKQAFETYFGNRKIDTLTPAGKPTKINLGKFWLEHKDRATKRELVFSPSGCRNHEYNLWRGFAVQSTNMPLEQAYDKCKLYLKHVKDIICDGDEASYNYVLAWLAHLVQKVGIEKPGVAIILKGREGTGKGSFVKPLIDMVGRNHAAYISNRQHFFSQFNTSLEDKVLVYLDEAVWAGSKSEEGILKSYITETTQTVERKGYERYTVESYARFILSSNEDWVVPAGRDARRYLVLNVSDKHMQDTQGYFKDLNEEFANGCAEALYVVLKNYDISGTDIRKPPHTEALEEQQYLSLGSVETWWDEVLEDQRLPRFDHTSDYLNRLYGDSAWPKYFDPKDLYEVYLAWCKQVGVSQYKIEKRRGFTQKLLRLTEQTGKRIDSFLGGERLRTYALPEVEKSIEIFKKQISSKH